MCAYRQIDQLKIIYEPDETRTKDHVYFRFLLYSFIAELAASMPVGIV